MREPFQGGWYTCPVCRKRFRIAAETSAWTFTKRHKNKPIYYCSWKCVRAMEKEAEDDREAEGAQGRVHPAAGEMDE